MSFKEDSRTHYVLKYIKFKGGSADVTRAADLFKGKIQDKNKARKGAELLVKDGCLEHVSGDVYRMTRKGVEVFTAITQKNMLVRVEPRD